MADASFAQTSFLGGEWSKAMQGRFDRPDYRMAMNVCLNSFPMETGAWTRRSGTMLAAPTRYGTAGRVISFDFKQASPYVIELTDACMRMFSGLNRVTTNDNQGVVSISGANPAVVVTGAAHGWSSGEQVFFESVPTTNATLMNRPFIIVVLSATSFSLLDGLTGSTVDGAALGTGVPGTVLRIKEIATPYVGTGWSSVRVVQADLPDRSSQTKVGALFLHGSYKPYVLTVESLPSASTFATFSFEPGVFKDGPYFDPIAGGALATPSALIGNINVTISFNAYDATKSYSVGDYVTDGAVNYKSLTDANVGHTPAISATHWVAVSAADAVGPSGFTAADIGRHIRLHSEPPEWASGSSYTAGTSIVRFGNPSVYYKCITNHVASAANTPNVSTTNWAIYPNGAIWSWGRITGLTNSVSPGTGTNIGDMTSGGGLAAAFDGVFSQAATASAERSVTASSGSGPFTHSSYVGKNYSGAGGRQVQEVTVYPSNDAGFAGTDDSIAVIIDSITLNLRGKATAPASASDGTLLGTSGAISNTVAASTITSSDQTTTWNFLWVEQITTYHGGK